MPIIGHCDSCIHWHRHEPPDNFEGECTNSNLHAITGDRANESTLYQLPRDSTFHERCTITGQSFGCVHHDAGDGAV